MKNMSIEKLKNKLQNNQVIACNVESTNLKTLAYTPDTKVLTILFNKKVIYQYENVNKEVVLKFLEAQEKQESLGKVFRENILNKFPYSRLNPNGSIQYTSI